TVAAFADGSLRFPLSQGQRHSRAMGLTEVGPFREPLAQTENDPVRALAAGLDALDFRYREVLDLDLGEWPWPRPPRRLDHAHGAKKPGTFANTVLLARRMVERGVRFVQAYHNNWDTHGNVAGRLPDQCRGVDRACYLLIQDLE